MTYKYIFCYIFLNWFEQPITKEFVPQEKKKPTFQLESTTYTFRDKTNIVQSSNIQFI